MKYLNKLLIIGVLFFIPSFAHAFTCTAVVGGGNWNSAATWTGSCNSTTPQTGDDVVLNVTSGNVAINVNTAQLNSFTMTGYLGTLTGASTLTVGGSNGTTQNVIFDGNISWTGILSLANGGLTANLALTTNGKALTQINISQSATTTLQDNLTFTNIKTASLNLNSAAGRLDLNGFTVSGNSAINRLFVASNTVGTRRDAIVVNGGSFSHTDFMDVGFNVSTDLSSLGAGNYSGDCGGNNNITFTASTTETWSGTSGGNWSANAWTSRVPLCQDDVVIASAFSASQTITNDMPRLGGNINWTGTTGNPAWSFGTAAAWNIFGSLTLASGQANPSGSGGFTFRGRTSHYITSNGKTMAQTGAGGQNGPGGTYYLMDAFSYSARYTVNNGTFNSNNLSATILNFEVANTANAILTAGSSTFTINGTGALTWSIAGSSAVVNADTSTIILSNTAATAKTFAGASKTYNNITFTGSNITVTGSNTCATWALSNGGLIGTKFTTATTQTCANFTSNGSAGSLVGASSTAATNATWTKTGGGTICMDYLELKDMTGSPASTFYAGTHSTDGTDNTNWTFTDCPAGGAAMIMPPIFFQTDE